MATYTPEEGILSVTLLAASGRELVLRVARHPSDSRAADAALRIAEAMHPNQGWRVLLVL